MNEKIVLDVSQRLEEGDAVLKKEPGNSVFAASVFYRCFFPSIRWLCNRWPPIRKKKAEKGFKKIPTTILLYNRQEKLSNGYEKCLNIYQNMKFSSFFRLFLSSSLQINGKIKEREKKSECNSQKRWKKKEAAFLSKYCFLQNTLFFISIIKRWTSILRNESLYVYIFNCYSFFFPCLSLRYISQKLKKNR